MAETRKRRGATPATPSLWQRLPVFRDHPPGLGVCFLVEMWERFSYYGMRALLILYLTEHFLLGDDRAFLLYGAWASMVYLLPVIGGAVADRWLGPRKGVTFGALLLVAGHFLMTFEGEPARELVTEAGVVVERSEFHLGLLYLALALIAAGVGFLKTNASTVVGALYADDASRRDAGFTVFYMGINLGAAAAPLLCGWVGQTWGWRYGFGLAGIGMLAGLLLYLRGQRHLHGLAEPPCPEALKARVLPGLRLETAIYLASLALVGGVWWVLHHPPVVGGMLALTGAALGIFVLWYALRRCDQEQRNQLLACAVLVLFTIGFWAFYEQMGSSMNLFADRMVDRELLGAEIPASTLQSLPALYVIALAPLFGWLWMALARRGREPSTPMKFVLAMAQIGVAFQFLVLGAALRPDDGKVALIWFALTFLFMVTGELCLAPVGMSMVTRLSPKRIVSTMMGAFLLAYSASSWISALIARLTTSTGADGDAADFETALGAYTGVYARIGALALVVAAALAGLTPLLVRWMSTSRPDAADRRGAPPAPSPGTT